MTQYAYFEHIQPGGSFSIEEDDGTVKFCYKIIIGDGYHGCLILENSDNFKIEFASPHMLVLQ